MSYMIEVLRQEHCTIEKLLCILERELSVFDRGDRPDYEVLLAALDYFKDYPDCCHHPKEDLIVEKIRLRDPTRAQAIGDLEGEHREGANRLRRVVQTVERVLTGQDIQRENVSRIIRDFIDRERRHMAMEERVLFPAALNTLKPTDWEDIARKLGNRSDPFYSKNFEEKFNVLRRNILKMEEEAEAQRATGRLV